MPLTFLGKDTKDDGSPTLYLTEHGTYLIQGWIVTDMSVLAWFELAEGETLVEVPKKLMSHLPRGAAVPSESDVVLDTGNTYVFQGPRVVDPAVLAQLDLPDHETVIEVPRAFMTAEVNDGSTRGADAATAV
jgi:hypothetical protein